jgi:vacuolar-type H+-ATPase subunit E/Vma4
MPVEFLSYANRQVLKLLLIRIQILFSNYSSILTEAEIEENANSALAKVENITDNTKGDLTIIIRDIANSMSNKYTSSSTAEQLFELSLTEKHKHEIDSFALALVGTVSPYIDDLETYVPEEARKLISFINTMQNTSVPKASKTSTVTLQMYKFGKLQDTTIRTLITDVARKHANIDISDTAKFDPYMIRACVERVQLGRLVFVSAQDTDAFKNALEAANITISSKTFNYITNVSSYGAWTSHIGQSITLPSFGGEIIDTIVSLDALYDDLSKLQSMTSIPEGIGANIDSIFNLYIPMLYTAVYVAIYLRYDNCIIIATDTNENIVYVNYYNLEKFDSHIKDINPTLDANVESILRNYVEYGLLQNAQDPSRINAVSVQKAAQNIVQIEKELQDIRQAKEATVVGNMRMALTTAIEKVLQGYYDSLQEGLKRESSRAVHENLVSNMVVKNSTSVDPDDIIAYVVSMRQKPLLLRLYNEIQAQFRSLLNTGETISVEHKNSAICRAICEIITVFIASKSVI